MEIEIVVKESVGHKRQFNINKYFTPISWLVYPLSFIIYSQSFSAD